MTGSYPRLLNFAQSKSTGTPPLSRSETGREDWRPVIVL
jgi:hypothetical protein